MIKRSFEQVTKYWNILVDGDKYAVNYGKIGTIGKVQVKSFESDLACMNVAENLIRQKLRSRGSIIFDELDERLSTFPTES
ncbi:MULTISPECIES: WGR domain-containing protein [unclassified Exiguobacterium]|uniref:WGR domain-containing protein n=1 Tax=unclassified Exiguobacterium TaxID=2644629 RepID=UPI001BE6C5DC|nr:MULTISPECIES: WGR domain-containing protein [unclassified Exiguobacterium]